MTNGHRPDGPRRSCFPARLPGRSSPASSLPMSNADTLSDQGSGMRILQRSSMISFQPAATDDDAAVCLRVQARCQGWGSALFCVRKMIPMDRKSPVDTHIGQRLKKYRQHRGMTVRELAEAAHVTPGQISHYERG